MFCWQLLLIKRGVHRPQWYLLSYRDQKCYFYLPRENLPVPCGVAPAPVALADLNVTVIIGSRFDLYIVPWLALIHPVVGADLLVVGGVAPALALVAAAVVSRPAFVAPEMNDASSDGCFG